MRKTVLILLVICIFSAMLSCARPGTDINVPENNTDKVLYETVSVPSPAVVDEYPGVSFTQNELREGITFESLCDGSEIKYACIKVSISGALRTGNEITFCLNGSQVGSIGRNQGSVIDISEGARSLLVSGENILTGDVPNGAQVKGSLIYYSDRIALKEKITVEGLSDITVSEDIFGCNFEITRSTWWQGLSAEMLNNRKFFADNNAGNPSGWVISGGEYVTDDKEGSICGSNYLILGDGDAASYSGESVFLQKGVKYQAEICAFKETKGKTSVELYINDKKVGSCTLGVTDGQYEQVTIDFTSDRDISDGKVTFRVRGEEMKVFAVSLMDQNNIRGMRPDVIESLKEIAPVSLRYPGGCCADRFDWKTAVLPRNERPPMQADEEGYTNMGGFLFTETYNQDTFDFGLEDFFFLCETVGAKPELTVSLVRGNAGDAADLVKYCKDNNHEVSLWYVGNEVYFFGNELYRNPALAASRTDEYIKAMREVDGNIRIVIGFCDSTDEMYNWSKIYFGNVSEQYDVISVHYYYGSDFENTDIFSGIQKLSEMAGISDSYNGAVTCLLSFIEKCGYTDMKNKDICVDEWNWKFGGMGTSAMFIGNACYLTNLINTESISGLSAASFFHPLEGQIEVGSGDSEITGTGYAFNLFRNHKDGILANISAPEDIKSVITANNESAVITVTNPTLMPRYIEIENVGFLGDFSSAEVKIITGNSVSTEDICTVSEGKIVLQTYTADNPAGYFIPELSVVQIILTK